jgi:hypothetical protein
MSNVKRTIQEFVKEMEKEQEEVKKIREEKEKEKQELLESAKADLESIVKPVLSKIVDELKEEKQSAEMKSGDENGIPTLSLKFTPVVNGRELFHSGEITFRARGRGEISAAQGIYDRARNGGGGVPLFPFPPKPTSENVSALVENFLQEVSRANTRT